MAKTNGQATAGGASGGRTVSDPATRTVAVGGQACRVWSKGEGEPVGFLAGIGGLLRWTPFLDRLARSRTVIVPSLPGFPGAGRGHDSLDTLLDWLLATHDLLDEAGLSGHDLVGVSIGGTLAAEVAAAWPAMVRRLVLVSPLGIFDEAEPVCDIWAQQPGVQGDILCSNSENYAAATALPDGEDLAEWQIQQIRANEAAVRILWPLSDTGLAKRLPRIHHDTLILWGEADRVVPPSYAERFAEGILGRTTVRAVSNAGHLADIDAPDEVAARIFDFFET